MEEISSKETFFLDDNLQSNINLNQIDKPLINKNSINIRIYGLNIIINLSLQ